MKLLSDQEIQSMLTRNDRWTLLGIEIVREWAFPDFAAAISFVNKIAELAEQANHHPDIDIRYNRVRLALISHDAGGLTSRDRALVQRIDEQFQNLEPSTEKNSMR